MANIVIVTNNCYLLADSIVSITLDVNHVDNSLMKRDDPIGSLIASMKKARSKGKRAKRRPKPKVDSSEEYSRKIEAGSTYQVTINYIPVSLKNSNQNQNMEIHSCCFTVLGRETAMVAYRDVVKQIREQIPDQIFLNDLVDRLLGVHGDNQDADKPVQS